MLRPTDLSSVFIHLFNSQVKITHVCCFCTTLSVLINFFKLHSVLFCSYSLVMFTLYLHIKHYLEDLFYITLSSSHISDMLLSN